jgi:hypothetical protein
MHGTHLVFFARRLRCVRESRYAARTLAADMYQDDHRCIPMRMVIWRSTKDAQIMAQCATSGSLSRGMRTRTALRARFGCGYQ